MTLARSLFVLICFFGSQSSFSYTLGRTPSGTISKWPSNVANLHLNFDFSSLDASSKDFAESKLYESAEDWNDQLGKSYPNLILKNGPSVNLLDGVNSVSFSDSTVLGSAVAGLTIISYDSESGNIKEADIIFNKDISHASGYLNVFKHEFGHFLGLSHSEVLQSVMVYEAFDENDHVHSDDVSGVKAIYGDSAEDGSIIGIVEGGAHIGVFGAHVQAISANTGSVVASSISEVDGRFSIHGLDESDSYYIYVSPLKNLGVLPSFFDYSKTDFCPGTYVGKFFTGCGGDGKGRPQAVNFKTTTSAVNIGVVSIGCDSGVNKKYVQARLGISSTSTIALVPTVEGQFADSFVGSLLPADLTSTTTYTATDSYTFDLTSLTPTGLKLDVKVVSVQLGSPLQLKATLSRTSSTISQTGTDLGDIHLSSGLSTTTSNNFFTLKIEAKMSDLDLIVPAASSYLDSTPRYLVISTVRNSAGDIVYQKQTAVIEDNNKCLGAPNTYAAQRASYVAKTSMASNKKNKSDGSNGPLACGTIDDTQPPMGPMSGLCVVFLPLFFILIKRNILLS